MVGCISNDFERRGESHVQRKVCPKKRQLQSQNPSSGAQRINAPLFDLKKAEVNARKYATCIPLGP